MDGEVCRVCRRKVHDLGAMSETQRVTFLDACSDEICVKYTLPLPRKVAALALSAAVIALPVAAEEQTTTTEADKARPEAVYNGVDEAEEVFIIIGGIKVRSKREYVDAAEDEATPELPVVYEEEADKG
jgi:hypothetical protein